MSDHLPVILVVVDVRSAYNVGSLFRTADAAGVQKVILIGLTPYPKMSDDPRLPHIAVKATRSIAKTALGAEQTVPFSYFSTAAEALDQLRQDGYRLWALERTSTAVSLFQTQPDFPIALIVGAETTGLSNEVLNQSDQVVQIPQFGQKESLNVSVAAGIALYFIRFYYQ